MIQEIEKNKLHYDFMSQYLTLPTYEEYISKEHWKQLGYYSHDGKLVGSVIFALHKTKSIILYTAVVLDWRNTGINQLLAYEVEKITSYLGLYRVTVNIRQKNTASIVSFLKSGFLIYKSDSYYKNGDLKISLAKELKYVHQTKEGSSQKVSDM